MQLYGYWRSSAAYRVRLALALKGLEYGQISLDLRQGAEQDPAYTARNPQALVPALELDDGTLLGQSLAIIEYLDEQYPQPPLLPAHALGRARVRAMALAIACEIHPLNNLRVLNQLKQMGHTEEQRNDWYRHWVYQGFNALEALLAQHSGRYCYGDQLSLADICLVPQVYNAERFDCDLSPYPLIQRIAAQCNTLPAFQHAHPSRQPDAS